ncbi:DUF421 domain-containing protein [Mycolicibacterium aichiense]|uniref:YetF C-terminal domain-containing protein n=1 Tax=Mycolicibacterium aichiense TaxID=1799 RepID=A0AAD1HPL8_9MYCO|nr:YetF domain-containing protein [Mycolicibacterium aichiense]MCV7019478.1 DUF421 domain-containing protein [Mycolicibacterium aichiense]BBX08213.1 hypothetical protein MAIC_30160 [Mycolicibacterium aichiense]STZ82017.1 Protein of uncharacterised function (DUF421) [Mycolicibacterium aichiense]
MNGWEHALIGDWHQALWAAVKALTLFVTAAGAFRVTQRRAIAEFTPFDWVTAVAVGAIVGRTATASDTAWLTGAVALVTLMSAHALIARMRFVPSLRRLVDPPLRVLIRDGEIDERNLRRSGLTRTDLDAALRQHGHDSPRDVHLALFEERGAVSVLPAKSD